ncbi:MAG TPA: alkaline phosphatase PhoX [Burkholderiales bacterium]|nr:alkaline phosphatase PhoX [Burkholderiales bacterium]
MENHKMDTTRRQFLKRSALLTGGSIVTAATLQTLSAHGAWAASSLGQGARGDSPMASGYGPLVPVADQNGQQILALPEGFHYTTFGKVGDPLLNGGGMHARNHDGMAAFPGPDGTVRLIRNQEVRNGPNDFTLGITGDPGTRYDVRAMAGTITLDYDPVHRRTVREFISLNGTIVNCSGGLAYADAGWITCEETTAGPNQGWAQKHGYSFLVPVTANGTVPAIPIPAMGRFSKEAAVADLATGIVYQTEDNGSNSGFYRYLPNDASNLLAGGTLQMLKVTGTPQYDTRQNQTVGTMLPVEWVTIASPDPNLEGGAPGCFAQGFALGGARFYRLEGVFRGEGGSIFFVSTSGGNVKNGDISGGFAEGYGQLWQYLSSPAGDKLVLIYESTGRAALDSPDNLCVTPSGGILFCEDDAGSADSAVDTHPLAPGITDVNRLIGLTRSGVPFEFAVNRLNDSEFAGACFSPDGNILFVNIFGDGSPGSGMTCAITGPWRRGPL